jgi:hypothetical protein
MYIAQRVESLVRADKRSVTVGFRQTLEQMFEEELKSVRADAVRLVDVTPAAAIEWWLHCGPSMPLLYVFARVAIVTPVSTVEVERKFATNGKFFLLP